MFFVILLSLFLSLLLCSLLVVGLELLDRVQLPLYEPLAEIVRAPQLWVDGLEAPGRVGEALDHGDRLRDETLPFFSSVAEAQALPPADCNGHRPDFFFFLLPMSFLVPAGRAAIALLLEGAHGDSHGNIQMLAEK